MAIDPGWGLLHLGKLAEVPPKFEIITVQHVEKSRRVMILLPTLPEVTHFPKDLRFHSKAFILRALWKRDFHMDPLARRGVFKSLNAKAGRRTYWNLITPLETNRQCD